MIGVAAPRAQHDVVHEFFELFKTPWEPYVPGRRYRVVLSADGVTEPDAAPLTMIYGAREQAIDRCVRASVTRSMSPAARWREATLPLYGPHVTFAWAGRDGELTADGRPLEYVATQAQTTVRRIGYDLFGEVAHLLRHGQPVWFARVPSLELHIALLRQRLADANVTWLEVPPRPHDARFICCLTHDLDFVGIRRQRVNPTLAGFALRGTVGTIVDTVRGRRPVAEAARNVLAVLSLPLILLKLRADLWDPFRDYAHADRGHAATFFVVPFKNHAGHAPDGTVEARRAVSYGIDDIKQQLGSLPTPPCELAVHGLDAWCDEQRGRDERHALTALTGQRRSGVRMHWLYFDADSPRRIEAAGFDYDSTYGYNDAIGYRAGTLQAFRPPGTERLLELPLAIMDSAMLYPNRMGLSHDEAIARCRDVVRQARASGGALVINWHDRSLAPERQWGRCYEALLDAVEAEGGMFLSAGQAVDWFRWRRGIRFHEQPATREVMVNAPPLSAGLPAACIALRGPDTPRETAFAGGACRVDV